MRAVRFRPPPTRYGPEIRWVLHRAFARPGLGAASPGDPEEAFRIAARFDLVPRIAARTEPRVLADEVGSIASQFKQKMHACAASGLRIEAALRLLAELAEPLGIPLVVLKGCALRLNGISPPGSRSFCDLDVLVPLDRIGSLQAALVRSGWVASPLGGTEYQEASLKHPTLGMIEIHRTIPGVRAPRSRRSFDARMILDAGLTQPAPGFPVSVCTPVPAILAAHALVHGLAQHGSAPGTYPLFRLLADLQDLGGRRELLLEAGRFLRDLDSGDLEAVATLLGALEAGTAHDLPAGPARTLLEHLVAAYLDADYVLGLKTSLQFFQRPSDIPFAYTTLRSVFVSVVLSRHAVDAIYGPPKWPGGYAARQLLRPLDLGIRLGRSAWARLARRSPARS